MTYDIDENVQVLDSNGIWRNGIILSRLTPNRKYRIHLKNFSSRFDSEYSADLIRECIDERVIQKNALKCKITQLNCLAFNDKIIYKSNDGSSDEIEGKVFENDPFNCFVKVLAGSQTKNIMYEQIVLTSRNSNFSKYLTQINNTMNEPNLSTSQNDVSKKKVNKFMKKTTSTPNLSKTCSTKQSNKINGILNQNTKTQTQTNNNSNKTCNKSATPKQNNRIYIDTAVDDTNQDIIIASPVPSPKRIRLETSTASTLNCQNPTVLLTALPNICQNQLASIITSTPRVSTISTTSTFSAASSISSVSANSTASTTLIRQTINNLQPPSCVPVTITQTAPPAPIPPPPPPIPLSQPLVQVATQAIQHSQPTQATPQLPPPPPPPLPPQSLLQPINHSKLTNIQPNQSRTNNSSSNFQPNRQLNQFNSKDYIDNLVTKLNTRIDNIQNPTVDLTQVNKTIDESTIKITSSIDRLTNILSDFLTKQAEIQLKLNELIIANQDLIHQQNKSQNTSTSQDQNKIATILNDSNYSNGPLQQQNYNNLNGNSIMNSNLDSEPLNPVVITNNQDYLAQEEVNEIQSKSQTAIQFANYLMERLFKPEEYIGCNVNGRGVNRLDIKKPLDRKRMKYIELLTNKMYNPDSDIYLWPRCVKQMNRRILELCPQNKFKSQITTSIKVDRSI